MTFLSRQQALKMESWYVGVSNGMGFCSAECVSVDIALSGSVWTLDSELILVQRKFQSRAFYQNVACCAAVCSWTEVPDECAGIRALWRQMLTAATSQCRTFKTAGKNTNDLGMSCNLERKSALCSYFGGQKPRRL